MSSRSRGRSQRGAALIVALLVVTMVVMLGTTLSSDFLLMFRRVENQLHGEQAYAYLLGAEGLARAALLQDMEQDGNDAKFDHLGEDWAQELRLPTDYGWIGGHIEDAQGRFNLNSLAGVKQQGTVQQRLTPLQLQFVRLLQSLPLEKPLELNEAQALTEAIGDWIDEDDEIAGLGGAEVEYYTHADPPGRPGNRDMVSPSELMWVKGMTPEIYRLLAPLVTVWPGNVGQTGGGPQAGGGDQTDNGSRTGGGSQAAAGSAGVGAQANGGVQTGVGTKTGGGLQTGGGSGTSNININTAPPALLACLGDDQSTDPLSESDIKQIVNERNQRKYFKSLEEVLSSSPSLQNKQINLRNFGVRSNYFILNAQTEFQGRMYSLHSLIYRDDSNHSVRVIERTFGEW